MIHKGKNMKTCMRASSYLCTLLLGATIINCLTPSLAAAQVTTTFSGNLNTSNQYLRPNQVSGAPPWTAGTTLYNYFTEQFIPSGSGNFTIEVLGTSTLSDPVLYLYQNSFDPNNVSTNGIIADDDSGPILLSRITNQALLGGTTYIIVATSFLPNDTGLFNFQIVGPFGVQVGSTNGYVTTAASTGTASLAQYLSNFDDSGDLATVATHLNTLGNQDVAIALKTIFPVNSSVNAQSLSSNGTKTTNVVMSKIGTVLGGINTAQAFNAFDSQSDISGWIFAHKKTRAEKAQDFELSLASSPYDNFEKGQQGFWTEAVVNRAFGDSTNNTLGYDTQGRGVVSGYEYAISESALLGILAGYFSTDIDLDRGAGTTESDNYNIGIYGQKLAFGAKISGMLLYGYGDNQSRRQIDLGGVRATPIADFNSHNYSATLSASKLFEHGAYKIEPFATVNYNGVHTDSYIETRGGAFNMNVSDDSFSSAGAQLGLTFQRDVNFDNGSALNVKIKPYVGHDWEIEESNTTISLASATSTTNITGRDMTTFQAGIGGEVGYDVNDSVSLKLGFDASQNKYEDQYVGFAGLGMKF
jgi:subtilase-type serine protease